MIPCKKILCPTDFSEASYLAIENAKELAKYFSAELLLMHVRPQLKENRDVFAVQGINIPVFERQQTDAARMRLEEVASKRLPHPINTRLILNEGDAGHEILQTAINESVDLIVIATHGMTGWRHYLYGSVAQRVIQHTPCSVWVVRYANEEK